MKIILTILTAILTTMTIASAQTAPPLETGVSQDLARWRAANYSDVRYKLNITLEKNAPLMKGTIEVSVKLTETGAKSDLILDWRTTQFEKDKDKPFAEVEKVNEQIVKETAQNGVFDYQTNKEHLIVSKKYLKTGENTLLIKFASPIKTSGAAITRYVDKEDGAEYIYSLFVPSDASTAFPVFDQPDLKARFSLTLVIPAGLGWKAISNEAIYSRTQPECPVNTACWSTVVFKETKPISTYVFAFAAGEFEEFANSVIQDRILSPKTNQPLKSSVVDGSNMLMKIYVRKSQAEKFKAHEKEVFRLNREGVKFLEDYFDYKFPFPKYDLVLIPEFPFGGMEHAGATFLRESSVIFPTEPTKNDYVSRANVIFHEAAHQWFGDTVTMKWFDDLWLKEGFAEFMAYKTLEKVMPEYNAWKIFYERNKQAAYLTDSTKGTTPIYQEIKNLSAAKSAYGNIVYRKAPSFLKQAEFYLGEKEFQTAVRAFLKNHQYANAEWTDLVNEFETASKQDLKDWANVWVKKAGLPVIRTIIKQENFQRTDRVRVIFQQTDSLAEKGFWKQKFNIVLFGNVGDGKEKLYLNQVEFDGKPKTDNSKDKDSMETSIFWSGAIGVGSTEFPRLPRLPRFVFPNHNDYGYGIFLLDKSSRDYIFNNIYKVDEDFIRAMMWGSLWDSVREAELAPQDYVELVIKNINVETDESTIQTLLGRVSTAMNYYLSDEQRAALAPKLEEILIDKMQNSATVGQRITFYRAFLNIASSQKAQGVLREILSEDFGIGGGNTKMRPGVTQIGGKVVRAARPAIPLKPKDRADIIAKLILLGDTGALDLLKTFEKSAYEDADRYAYAARAAVATKENKAKYWNDFVNDKTISESWIESAFVIFNSPRQADLTLPYLEKALTELPNLKKTRKIFFVNGWLAAFIGGQKSDEALKIVNVFLEKNPNLDKDLRLKILENSDNLERAVKIREKYGK